MLRSMVPLDLLASKLRVLSDTGVLTGCSHVSARGPWHVCIHHPLDGFKCGDCWRGHVELHDVIWQCESCGDQDALLTFPLVDLEVEDLQVRRLDRFTVTGTVQAGGAGICERCGAEG